jgi:hypothetical protein
MTESLAKDLPDPDEQVITHFMATLARTPVSQPRLLEPDIVWLKAQLLRRWDAERKVRAPLELLEPLQLIAGFAAAALLLSWALPSLLRLLVPLVQ